MAKYGVYIIEFLRSEDYFDGETLHEILKLSLIETEYRWVDTKDEFEKALLDFNKSDFRYLHISCHADETGFEINGDEITNSEFQRMTKKYLSNKRVFLSVCKGANRDLASKIVSTNNAYSMVGIPIKLYFDKSALFWPSFYHLVNEFDTRRMKQNNIVDVIKKLVDLFSIPVNYYGRIKGSKTHMIRLKIRQGSTDNRKIKVIP